jgi:hypothetical protein
MPAKVATAAAPTGDALLILLPELCKRVVQNIEVEELHNRGGIRPAFIQQVVEIHEELT